MCRASAAHSLAESAALDVTIRELPNFLCDVGHLHMVAAEGLEGILNGLRRTFQFVKHNRRYDQRHLAPRAPFDQPARVFPEFFVLATTDHRSVGVDAKPSAPGNLLECKQLERTSLLMQDASAVPGYALECNQPP